MGVLDMLGIKRRQADRVGQADLTEPMPQQIDPYQTYNPGELADEVTNEFRRRQQERMPFELQWRLNIAFIDGNQYLDINPIAQTIEEIPKLYWWQEREVFNHIAPNIEVRIARLSRMRPILKVRPGSNEREDVRKTKVSSHLLKNIYYDQKMRDKITDMIPWLEATGTVLLKNYWDPEAGPEVPIQLITEEGAQQAVVREGDLGTVICPSQEIFPDSSFHQEISDCKNIIHAKAYHIQDIKDSWGVEVASEESSVLRLVHSLTGQGGLGINSGYRYTTMQLKDHALVKEFWEIPTKRWPKGRLIIVANGQLLHFGPLPYFVGQNGERALPFVKATCINRPGCFWGKTVAERLIPIQRRYNALRNRKAEYLNSCTIGGWLVEEGSVDLATWEQDSCGPGFIGEYSKGLGTPQRVQNPPLPNEFETEEHTLLQEFSILSGVSEISRQSSAPTGVKSGVALQLALEQDETRLSATASNIEETLIELGSQWLRLCKQYVKGYRVLESVGKNNVVDVYEWTGSDLKAEDVIIDSSSAMSESPAQRKQMVFDLMSAGLFIDPETGRLDRTARSRILEALDMGDWEDIDSSDQLHLAKAERENRMFTEGLFVAPAPFDDHNIHLKAHNEHRLSVEYEALVQERPEVAVYYDNHVAMHSYLVNQAMMASMQAAAMMQQGPEQPQGNNA